MEEKYVFTCQENSFVWENGVTRVEFCTQSKEESYGIKIWKKHWNRDCTAYWQAEMQQFMDKTAALEDFLGQLEYVYDCKPNKDWIAIRWDNKKLWGHKLTRRIVGETDVYEVSKRARVNCELYDVFLGRRCISESRFGLTFSGLKREHVEQLMLCLREYLLYVNKKKGED